MRQQKNGHTTRHTLKSMQPADIQDRARICNSPGIKARVKGEFRKVCKKN